MLSFSLRQTLVIFSFFIGAFAISYGQTHQVDIKEKIDLVDYYLNQSETVKNKDPEAFVNYYNQGDYERALKIYIQALELLEEEEDISLKAKIYDNIGLVYYGLQNFEKAVENSSKALAINLELKDSSNLIRNHNNLD